MDDFIPVASPALIGNEKKYVLDCLDTTWVSSNGAYIARFESAFSDFCGVAHALSCSNGTVALHLALLALGIGPGDEVIVPTMTYVASANAVTYCGAKPVFVDSETRTWNMDPEAIESCITPQTKAIIVVHLYGHPADMDPILEIAKRYSLNVVEDAAEAHGATYKGRTVGSLGHVSTFSFYGNKLITTGEGGMVCTNDESLARRIKQLKGQGQDPERRYWFPIVGYNYRMTNIQAAIGLAQVERIEWHIARRREVASWYRRYLEDVPGVQFSPQAQWAESVFWLSCVVLESSEVDRDEVMRRMLDRGIDTRPFFYPMHTLPPYRTTGTGSYPVAEWLADNGVNLPSSALLTESQVRRVAETLVWALEQ
ncbi:MAG: DegT/DnrJ/EryC1/StrS family aminotransferase [Planctomycetota bacterium]|jgi:perosamine synthetase